MLLELEKIAKLSQCEAVLLYIEKFNPVKHRSTKSHGGPYPIPYALSIVLDDYFFIIHLSFFKSWVEFSKFQSYL